MRDKRAAKCFKFYNNNLVLVIICFTRFCFARFGGFVSLFRVLVHAASPGQANVEQEQQSRKFVFYEELPVIFIEQRKDFLPGGIK